MSGHRGGALARGCFALLLRHHAAEQPCWGAPRIGRAGREDGVTLRLRAGPGGSRQVAPRRPGANAHRGVGEGRGGGGTDGGPVQGMTHLGRSLLIPARNRRIFDKLGLFWAAIRPFFGDLGHFRDDFGRRAGSTIPQSKYLFPGPTATLKPRTFDSAASREARRQLRP